MFRKYAGLILSLLISLSLVACGEAGPTQSSLSLPSPGSQSPGTAASNASSTAGTAKGATTAPVVAAPTITPNPNRPPEKVGLGYTAPDFTLTSMEQKTIKLSQFRGKPVLVNFWATWCGPCKEELPLLTKTYEAYKDRLVVLGVDVAEEEPVVRLKIREVGITYTNVLDQGGKVANLYMVNAYPHSVFLDKDGVIQAIRPGAWTESTLKPYLDKLLS